MKKAEKIATARIQRAVTGLQIPMMSIVALNRVLETRIAEGATDDQLAIIAREFVAQIA
jgi:hypothetical protein